MVGKYLPMENFAETDPKIEINYGCILLPAAMLVWWIWMKQSTRQVIARVVEPRVHVDEESAPEAEYSTW